MKARVAILLVLLIVAMAAGYPPFNQLFINPEPLLVGQGYPQPVCQREPIMIARETVPGNLHAWWLEYGDFDFDDRITGNDLLWFNACYSGSFVPYPRSVWYQDREQDIACWLCDSDQDGDVDMDDYGMMQRSEVRR